MEKAVESHSERRKCLQLVLFPFPFQGHINPMIQLANILYSKGFSITIVHTQFNSLNPSECPHFSFRSIQDGLSESEASSSDLIGLVSNLNVKCANPFRECLIKLLSDVSKEPICCLITDAFCYFTPTVSESISLRRIVLGTASVCGLLSLVAFQVLQDLKYNPVQGIISLLFLLKIVFL